MARMAAGPASYRMPMRSGPTSQTYGALGVPRMAAGTFDLGVDGLPPAFALPPAVAAPMMPPAGDPIDAMPILPSGPSIQPQPYAGPMPVAPSYPTSPTYSMSPSFPTLGPSPRPTPAAPRSDADGLPEIPVPVVRETRPTSSPATRRTGERPGWQIPSAAKVWMSAHRFK